MLIFQDRVTCGAVLAKAGGGCFGIRRLPALQNVWPHQHIVYPPATV